MTADLDAIRARLAAGEPRLVALIQGGRRWGFNSMHDLIAHAPADLAALCDEVGSLRAILAGRCLADITHRDEGHRQSACILAADHETAHDDGLGCTWTDADHWQLDTLSAAIERVRELHRPIEAVVVITFGGGPHVTETRCRHCATPYPCPTLRALDGAE